MGCQPAVFHGNFNIAHCFPFVSLGPESPVAPLKGSNAAAYILKPVLHDSRPVSGYFVVAADVQWAL